MPVGAVSWLSETSSFHERIGPIVNSCLTGNPSTSRNASIHSKPGWDAMVTGSIGGRSVTGFTDRTQRTSYSIGDTSTGFGICQVCHDPAEVDLFNWTSDEEATH